MNRLPLSAAIKRYLELKQALGRGYAVEQQVLLSLNVFLVEQQIEVLTADSFSRWCKTQQPIASGVLRNRMRIVRNFCLYQQRVAPDSFVPDIHLFPLAHQPVLPYIFSETDIRCLLKATATLPCNARSPLRSEVFRLAVVLLYTTGMRRGELIRLLLSDYDPPTRTLHIRESKFHKSRYLPLSPDADQEINTYFGVRRVRHLPITPDTPLLWNGYGGGYTGSGFGRAMRQLFRLANIRTPEGRLPRTHDLRHAFAVNALLRWYRAGVDVQAKLPLLAAYMGHVSIASTEYYLPFIEDVAVAASDRFAAYCGDLVTPLIPLTGDSQ